MKDPMRSANSAQMGAAAKALLLLGAFECHTEVIGVSEIARRAALPKSTVHRILGILVEAGFVHHLPVGYQLSGRLATLGNRATARPASALRPLLLPCLVDLHQKVATPVALSVVEGGLVRCVERVHSLRQATLAQAFADDVPAHVSASGKVILAFSGGGRPPADEPYFRNLCDEFDQVRKRGVATETISAAADVTMVVAPVFGPKRVAAASLSVMGTSSSRIDALTAQLRETAYACAVLMTSRRADLSPRVRWGRGDGPAHLRYASAGNVGVESVRQFPG